MKVQIDFWNGKDSLEYEAENIKEAVLLAIKDGKSLSGANLVRANLVRANLYGANLYGANLEDANLYGANLVRANLYGANLYGANLVRANLYGANLEDANLYGANLEDAAITLLMGAHQRYSVIIINGDIKIGCERHSIEEWENFKQKEIIEMDGKEALKWWKQYKPIIIPLAKLRFKELKKISAKPKKGKAKQ